MNDDDEDVDAIIAEAVARAVEPLHERIDALQRNHTPAIGCVKVQCSCGWLVSARGSEALMEGYRDHVWYAHHENVPVVQ